MLLTIAIPCYNNERTIANAVDSAIKQNYDSEYEILIVNNASTDGTKNILDKYDDAKIRVVTNKSTVNLFANHNICLKEAKGDYVLFCHSDDELLPDALKILDNKIKERLYPEKYIVWGRSMFRDYFPMIKSMDYNLNTIIAGQYAITLFILSPSGLTPSGTCYSRLSTIERGGFDEIMSSSIVPHDWTILMKSALAGFEFEQIDRIIFKRVDASTAKSTNSKQLTINAHREALKMFLNGLSEENRQQLIDRVINNCHNCNLICWKPFLTTKQIFGIICRLMIKKPLRLYRFFKFI